MAEIYTVTINNTSPTEITGGRVGHFKIPYQGSLWFGGGALAVTYGPLPLFTPTVTDGMSFGVNQGNQWYDFYVTSPDEIYSLVSDAHSGEAGTPEEVVRYHEWPLTIFHNR